MAKRKVIIVGGGLAGLSAAYELSDDEKYDIHLIEKNDVLGGRVQSCSINGQMIDVGGFLVYPWYDRYHQLIKELKLKKELIKIPPFRDYFVGHEKYKNEYDEGFDFSFKEMVGIFIKVFPNPLIDTDPTEPELHAYDDKTIKDYLNSLNLDTEKTNYYLSAFDTYLQGYCYGPVYAHKMAFMAATIFQNMLHGDVHAASYLKNGSKVFIDTIHTELIKRGIQFHLNCELIKIDNNQIVTNHGIMTADDFIFCHTPAVVSYSRFITATVSYSGKATVLSDTDWGSCFYKDDPVQLLSVLSVVHLEKLYTQKTAQHLNLNIKVNDQNSMHINNQDLLEIIRKEMQIRFKDISILKIVHRADWNKAMPVAEENFADAIRNKQGHNNCYYAGDFMGCPSMETALMSGKRAAEKLKKNAMDN